MPNKLTHCLLTEMTEYSGAKKIKYDNESDYGKMKFNESR